LAVAVLCAITAIAFYLPAEAKATAFHDFYRHFVHPWGNVVVTILILACCAIAVACPRSGRCDRGPVAVPEQRAAGRPVGIGAYMTGSFARWGHR